MRVRTLGRDRTSDLLNLPRRVTATARVLSAGVGIARSLIKPSMR